MVEAITLLNLKHQQPFQPFRLHLKDGRGFDIRFPRLFMVGRQTLNVYIPLPDDPHPILPIASHCEYVNVADVERVEMLTVAQSTAPC